MKSLTNADLQSVWRQLSGLQTKPFIRWAGGKTQLLPPLIDLLPSRIGKYYEPFLGGGALFFALQPSDAFLSDINPRLINAYVHVRDNPDELIERVQRLLDNHNADQYVNIRNQLSKSSGIESAAYFIYLNKTCFNGLYREGKNGDFNVPIGRTSNGAPPRLDPEVIIKASVILAEANIAHQRYDAIKPVNGDFVYLDPPYDKTSKSSFTGYSKFDFRPDDHRTLAEFCQRLADKGVYLMISNSNTELVKDAFSDFSITEVDVQRSISANPKSRVQCKEVIIRSYN